MLSSLLKTHHVSRSDLALRLNVSLQTIHNWCGGRIRIPSTKLEPLCQTLSQLGASSEDLSQLVATELAAHGLRPDRLTTRAPTSRRFVMLMTWDLSTPGLFGPITKIARTTLEELGYECIVVDCNAEHRLRRGNLAHAIALGVDGLLLCGVPGDVPDADRDLISSLDPALAAGIPIVLLKPWTGAIDLPSGVGSIGWDSVAAVQQAVGILKSSGHTRIRAILSGTGAGFGGRYRGMDQAWSNLGIPFSDDSIIWAPSSNVVPELIDGIESSTGLFTPPSHLPVLSRACFEAGIQWPDHISITSLGNTDLITPLATRPFTFVNIPIGRASRGAAQLLTSMIQGDRFETGQEYVVYGASAMRVENLQGGSVGPPPNRSALPRPLPKSQSA